MESSALIAQTRKSVKKLKDGQPRPFFVVKDGKEAEVFICALPGPASQFKSARQINKYVAKKGLGEPCSDDAAVGAGLVTWADGTCFFDLSVKKGVSDAALQKAIKAAKAALGIKKFKVGRPDQGDQGDQADGEEAAEAEVQPPPPAANAGDPTPAQVVNEIRGKAQRLAERIRNIQIDLNNSIGRTGERVSQYDAATLEEVVKRMLKHDVELKGLIKDLNAAKKRLAAAVTGQKPPGYDDLVDLLDNTLLVAGSIVDTHIPSAFDDIKRRRAEVGAGTESPAPPPPPAGVAQEGEPDPAEVVAQILAEAQRRDERIRNIQITLNTILGQNGQNVSQMTSGGLEKAAKRVQELDVELKQQLKALDTAKKRLEAAVQGRSRPAGYDQAMALLTGAELIAGSEVQTHIPSSFVDFQKRREELKRR